AFKGMIRYYYSPLFWAATILFLSSIPSHELPDFSFWKFLTFDKFVHISLYGIFSFHIMKSCIRQYANWVIRYNATHIAIITAIVYGALIEVLQEFVIEDRNGDWLDMVANGVGAWLGTVVFKRIFYQYIR